MTDKQPSVRKAPRPAALVLLSLLTMLLLAANVSYFRSTPVRQQLGIWVSGGLGLDGASRNLMVDRVDRPLAADVADPENQSPGAPSVPGAEATPDSWALYASNDRQVVEEERLQADPRQDDGVNEPAVKIPQGTLIIPSLELEKPLDRVPVVDGLWNISNLADGVGWMETTGTGPGDKLAMVVIGHVTLPPPGGPGPFMLLSHLKIGDEIYYRDGNMLYVYEVDQREGVKPDEVDQIYKPDGDRIILVTCIGWNPLTLEYENRLLVQAKLVRSHRISRVLE